ncbi:MAG: tRNA modification GTPase [Planctomycetota bacterium]|jgi:tRNA modification GTPase
MFSTEDTIVAVSSAAGPASRSIVRLSGPEAIPAAEGVFSEPLADVGGFRAVSGRVEVAGAAPVAAPARAYLFRAPRSYTRQDVVELHVPGEVIAAVVCSALTSGGARPAEAGEFTARAFLTGRLDLARAEAVADIVDAEADAQLRSAVGVLGGSLGRLCGPAAEVLTDVLALTEASIDFAEEQVELAAPAEMARRAREVGERLSAALSAAGTWAPSAAEPHVAIAGRPNAGKSSLLNVLSGTDRAIVSAMAGTTRDVLTASADLDGCAVLLLDAAGLDVTDDPLERAAHAAARDAVTVADAVVFVLDAAAGDHRLEADLLGEVRQLNPRAPVVVLANKTDLRADVEALTGLFGPDLLAASAVTGAGLEALRRRLSGHLAELAPPQPGQLLLHDRQRRQIARAAEAAARAAELFERAGEVADVAELAAVELRAALDALKELTGEVVAEDVLAGIFARFCIGK